MLSLVEGVVMTERGTRRIFFWGGAHSVFFLDQGPAYTGLLSLFKCTDLYAYDL